MADISAIKLPDTNTYNLKDAKKSGIYTVIGTQIDTTAAWTGNINIPELYDGLTIAYYLPRTSAANVTLNLTLEGGTTTGPIQVYITGVTRAGTHYAAGSTIILTYWSAGSILINGTASTSARWTGSDYSIANSNTIGEYAGACIAGPQGLARYALIMQIDENYWESVVLTSGTGTSKTKNSSGFLLTSPILYQSAGTYEENTAAGQSACWYTYSAIDSRYSTNGGKFSSEGKSFYFIGTILNNKFYLKDTTWWTDTLPNFDDGYYYWYIGQFYDTYRFTLSPNHPIYYYKDNGIKILVNDSNGNPIDSTYLKLSGGTLTGDLTISKTSSIADNLPAAIYFQNIQIDNNLTNSGAKIEVFDDHNNVVGGANMVIQANTSMFFGAGDQVRNLYNTMPDATSERLFLLSDSGMLFESNAQTLAERRGMILNTSHQLVPIAAEVQTDNIGSIGSSDYKWANIYGHTFNGDNAAFNESVIVGGSTTNNSGCEMIFDSTTNSLNFIFK